MFFNSDSFDQSSLTMTSVKQWASDICNRHLTGGVDPTDALVKVAGDNSLTVHQIEVLAGEINKTIHQTKFAQVSEKYHAADFPLADAKTAVSRLQVTPAGEEKIAAAMPEPSYEKPEFDYFSAFGIAPEELDKTASVKAEGRKTQQKLAMLSTAQNDSYEMAKHASSNSEFEFIKTARQFVLDGYNLRGRLANLGTVIHAVKCAGQKDIALKPLAKLALALGSEGLIHPQQAEKVAEYLIEKKADETAPPELISEFLKARVVNGNHPLLITLKTYQDAKERERSEAQRCNVIDDKSAILGQKIRAL